MAILIRLRMYNNLTVNDFLLVNIASNNVVDDAVHSKIDKYNLLHEEMLVALEAVSRPQKAGKLMCAVFDRSDFNL